MPKPICIQCSTNDSLLWRNQESGQICNECYLANTVSKEAKTDVKNESDVKEEEDSKNGGDATPAKATGKGTRKSTRATRYKAKPAAGSGAGPAARGPVPAPRGRGRRSIFKRPPLKAPTATATVVSSDSIFYKGTYLQVGDIVSLLDVDGGTYYAQLRGFLTDQYCEKSAVLTWLLPTRASPPPHKCFDPATYIIGPEEELPRKLSYMEFVMHAPAEYYRCGAAPAPRVDPALHAPPAGFVWASMEPQDRT